jgi:glycine cleavage system H protein
MFPEELKYTKNHSWVKVEGENGRVGLTNYAQEQLSDIVTVELSEVGSAVTSMNPFGSIESVKATMDLITPVSGEIIEVNETLDDQPEKVNEDPYGAGWMIVVKLKDAGELDSLMPASDYETFTEAEAEES